MSAAADRAATTRLSKDRFDELAQGIVRELSDGEDETPSMWVQAARILFSGHDCA